jgi:hypothetical protein
MISIVSRAALIVVALSGCSKQVDGLPASTEWKAEVAAPAPAGMMAIGGGGAPALPPGHPAMPAGSAPHGTIGTDVSKMGLPAPDPARPIDPAHHVRGVLSVPPGLAGKLHDGGAVFVVVKRADHGAPSGPPLAVQRLSWKPGLPFELTERQAMIGGTQLTGDVIVTARYDQDGDALTKQAGDVMGQARVTIPADTVALALDTVLP